MAFPEPIWFLEDARLAVATEMPRVCVSCADPIVRESSMSTPDGWIHTRCHIAEREAYARLDPEYAEPSPRPVAAMDDKTECTF